MTIQISAFRWVPPFAQGWVRDLRPRWALEEAGLPYEVVLIDAESKNGPDYRRWQPFGQVPAYRDEEVELFESGAILLRLAARSEALAPADPAGRAKATSWVVAALNSIEPFVQNVVHLDVFHAGEAWTAERRPQAEAELRGRLADLAAWLGDRPWLEDRFSVGDIMMVLVLRELADTDAFTPFPTLGAYVARGLARPAFGRALEGQMRVFRENAPAE